MKKIKLNKLDKAYKKRLARLNKRFFDQDNIGLVSFIEYLAYTRDKFILDNSTDAVSKVTVLTNIILAFDIYNNCTVVEEKIVHWNNFCDLLKTSGEVWLR